MVFWRKKKSEPTPDQEEQKRKEDGAGQGKKSPVAQPPEPVPIPSEPSLKPVREEPQIQQEPKVEAEIVPEAPAAPVKSVLAEGQKKLAETQLPQEAPAEEDKSWFSRLSEGLAKSSNKITQGLTEVITKRKLDQAMLDELEDVLIMADLGPRTAAKIVETFSKDRFGKDISEEEVKEALAQSIADILRPVAKPIDFRSTEETDKPYVVLVCGVNGAGKTTTIGKVAYDLHVKAGRSVMMAAGDTFRAAALEQLQVWADRAQTPLVKKELGSDAAAVVYESYQKAVAEKAEVLLVDTAGRLQNKANLMAELQKIVRVLKKQDESLPHAVLLVLDATTGQNAFEQVRIFKEMVDVSGLIVTKLDGSAKGGVVVGLADQFGLPIHMVGVGEKIEDLQLFDPDQYARSLVGA